MSRKSLEDRMADRMDTATADATLWEREDYCALQLRIGKAKAGLKRQVLLADARAILALSTEEQTALRTAQAVVRGLADPTVQATETPVEAAAPKTRKTRKAKATETTPVEAPTHVSVQ